jgi:hypothetical protein
VVTGIEAPIGGDDIGTSVAVEIAGGDGIPPTGEVGEGLGGVGGFWLEDGGDAEGEPAELVIEDEEGAPFGGQDQFGKTVIIEITPDGAGDHAGLVEEGLGGGFGGEAVLIAAKEDGGGGARVGAGDDAVADEEVEVAIAVEIDGGDGAEGRVEGGKVGGGDEEELGAVGGEGDFHEANRGGGRRFITGEGGEESGAALWVDPAGETDDILGGASLGHQGDGGAVG